MLILCLDSSDRLLKTGLFENDNPIQESISDSMGNHSEQIISQIDTLLRQSGKGLEEVDLYAFNTGPGSFTGLRIGASAIAGLGISGKHKVFGFNSFEIMLEDVRHINGSYLFIITCRGQEFYYQYSQIMNGSEVKRSGPRIDKAERFELPPDSSIITLVGPGAAKFQDCCDDRLRQRVLPDQRLEDSPSLHSLAVLTLNAAKLGLDTHHGIPELYYMAPSQAEVNNARRKPGN